MSRFLGVDVAAAPAVALTLRGWTHQVDDIVALVIEAETLSDIPTGVHASLSSIASDAVALSAAIDRAASMVSSFRIDLASFTPRLSLPPTSPASTGASLSLAKWGIAKAAVQGETGDKTYVATDATAEGLHRRGLVAGLQQQIEDDFIAGRDTSASIERYRTLLGELTGDSSGVGALTAMSLMQNGLPPEEIPELFSHGHDSVFARIAAVMHDGTAPTEAHLHSSLFPPEYVAWHEHTTAVALYESAAAALAASGLGDASALRDRDALDAMQHLIDDLPKGSPVRNMLEAVVFGAGVERHQLRSLSQLLGEFVETRLDDLGDAPYAFVDSLHGPVPLDSAGRLGAFEAIGASASTIDATPSSFVGDAYAQFYTGFDLDDIGAGFEYLRFDRTAAAAFFASLGAAGTARILLELRSKGVDETSEPIVRDLSGAFGEASHELPVTFGSEVVSNRPRNKAGWLERSFIPEFLFAEGTFDDDFLAQAVAATLTLPDSTLADRWAIDPRSVILAPAIDAGVGANVVGVLVETGALERILLPTYPILDRVPDRDGPPLVSALLVQAATDPKASQAVIDMVGAEPVELDVEVAFGVSSVVAANLAFYQPARRDELPSEALLTAAQNVFMAGTGFEIELAMEVMIIEELAAGAGSSTDEWWDETVWAGVLGHLEGRLALIAEQAALDRDAMVRNQERWLSLVSSGSSVFWGVAGLFSGGALPTVGGFVSTGLGLTSWLYDDDNAAEGYYRSLAADLASGGHVGGDLALFAAVREALFTFPKGAHAEIVELAPGQLIAQVTNEAGVLRVIPIGSAEWRTDLEGALDEAGATIDIGGRLEGAEFFAEYIGDQAVERPRSAAFYVASQLSHNHDRVESRLLAPSAQPQEDDEERDDNEDDDGD